MAITIIKGGEDIALALATVAMGGVIAFMLTQDSPATRITKACGPHPNIQTAHECRKLIDQAQADGKHEVISDGTRYWIELK